MLREAVAIIRQLGSGRAGFRGDYFSADGSELGWRIDPPPIFLSARGPRMLELGGEIADGIIVHGIHRDFLDYVRSRVAHGAARSDRDPGECRIAVMLDVEVDGDEAAAIDRLRPRCTLMAGGTYADELIPVYGFDPGAVGDAPLGAQRPRCGRGGLRDRRHGARLRHRRHPRDRRRAAGGTPRPRRGPGDPETRRGRHGRHEESHQHHRTLIEGEPA